MILQEKRKKKEIKVNGLLNQLSSGIIVRIGEFYVKGWINVIIDRVIVDNKAGLHAKPASLFVQRANDFKSEIYIKKDSTRVNAKSIMGVMILAVQKGDEIEIETSGDDEKRAMEQLKLLIENKFDFADEV